MTSGIEAYYNDIMIVGAAQVPVLQKACTKHKTLF